MRESFLTTIIDAPQDWKVSQCFRIQSIVSGGTSGADWFEHFPRTRYSTRKTGGRQGFLSDGVVCVCGGWGYAGFAPNCRMERAEEARLSRRIGLDGQTDRATLVAQLGLQAEAVLQRNKGKEIVLVRVVKSNQGCPGRPFAPQRRPARAYGGCGCRPLPSEGAGERA